VNLDHEGRKKSDDPGRGEAPGCPVEPIWVLIFSVNIDPGKPIYRGIKKSPAYIQVRPPEIRSAPLLKGFDAGNDFSFNNEVHGMGGSR